MFRLHFFLLLLIQATLRQNAFGSKIINGKKVDENSMVYMASVQNHGTHTCGGFLISEDFVLTAAHCDKESLSVILGTHNLRNVDDSMRYNVKKCKHPSYENIGKGNDIMLLKLSRKAQLGERVQTVPLPSRHMELKENEKCLVAGWGSTRSHGVSVKELLQADVPLISTDLCREKWDYVIPDSVICAGGYGTDKGFCQGDSGGPLVCNGIAVGVVSFNKNLNCRYPDVPNVYTEISTFLPWIKMILERNDC